MATGKTIAPLWTARPTPAPLAPPWGDLVSAAEAGGALALAALLRRWAAAGARVRKGNFDLRPAGWDKAARRAAHAEFSRLLQVGPDVWPALKALLRAGR